MLINRFYLHFLTTFAQIIFKIILNVAKLTGCLSAEIPFDLDPSMNLILIEDDHHKVMKPETSTKKTARSSQISYIFRMKNNMTN